MLDVFKFVDFDGIPGHKRRLEVQYSHTDLEVTRDGESGILVRIEDIWQNADSDRFNSRAVSIHLEQKEAIELAKLILRRFGRIS